MNHQEVRTPLEKANTVAEKANRAFQGGDLEGLYLHLQFLKGMAESGSHLVVHLTDTVKNLYQHLLKEKTAARHELTRDMEEGRMDRVQARAEQLMNIADGEKGCMLCEDFEPCKGYRQHGYDAHPEKCSDFRKIRVTGRPERRVP